MGWTYYTQPNWGAPADVTIGINHSISVGRGDKKDRIMEWRLEWEFRLGPQHDVPGICFGPGFQNNTGATSRSTAEYYTGGISFNISNSTGVIPDLTSGDACSIPLGPVGYLGRNETDLRCPLVTWPRPNPTSCAFSIDEKAADHVSQAMIKEFQCKGAK
jgi:hypothetical protein